MEKFKTRLSTISYIVQLVQPFRRVQWYPIDSIPRHLIPANGELQARRRHKKRTHVPAVNPTKNAATAGIQPLNASASRTPKTMVIRIGAGEVGPSVSKLVRDVRTMMEPHTAARLRERKSNKLRDYTTMAGPLGVTQLLLFSRNAASGSTTLRITRCPRGPTIHFRVKNYSLCSDVQKSMRNPKTPGKEYTSPPLVRIHLYSLPICLRLGM